jgi:hypothetical protein
MLVVAIETCTITYNSWLRNYTADPTLVTMDTCEDTVYAAMQIAWAEEGEVDKLSMLQVA